MARFSVDIVIRTELYLLLHLLFFSDGKNDKSATIKEENLQIPYMTTSKEAKLINSSSKTNFLAISEPANESYSSSILVELSTVHIEEDTFDKELSSETLEDIRGLARISPSLDLVNVTQKYEEPYSSRNEDLKLNKQSNTSVTKDSQEFVYSRATIDLFKTPKNKELYLTKAKVNKLSNTISNKTEGLSAQSFNKSAHRRVGKSNKYLLDSVRQHNHEISVHNDTWLKSSDCMIHGNCTRRCIRCSNTELDECNNPSELVLPVEQCPHKDDLCFTKHNPFGIVTRGCYSMKHTITYFSCACNLCNYLASQEMPFFFSELPDWKQDVITISRINSIGGRPYHGIECLECEVWNNVTEKDMNKPEMYCLEGDLEHNPYKRCQDDEVCGIKVIRGHYLWRGCLQYPVYNSWWSLCDSNFCNNEPLIVLDDIYLNENYENYSY